MITDYIRVFIENEAGKNRKNYYNEKTLDYLKSIEVSREYPYPYGFILNTTNQDGDNLDCYIITNRFIKKGQIIACIPVAILEQLEDGIEDNNILAVLPEDKNKIDLNKDIIKNKRGMYDKKIEEKIKNLKKKIFQESEKLKEELGK